MSTLKTTLIALFLTLLVPSVSYACSVCYGNPESPLSDGLNWGIAVLLGFTGFVCAGFMLFMISLYRRSGRTI